MAHAAPSKPARASLRYDVFVSHRRDKGSGIARLLAERLSQRGFREFLDVDALGSGAPTSSFVIAACGSGMPG